MGQLKMIFKEFKCDTHGYAWTTLCFKCKVQYSKYKEYYGLINDPPLININTHFYDACLVCGMFYSHNRDHPDTKNRRVEWWQLLNTTKELT